MSDIGIMVAELIAAGCSPDVAAQVVANAFVAGSRSASFRGIPPDSAAEKRRAYDRERKRKSTGNPPESTGVPVSPIDTKIIKVSRQNSDRPSRGTRIDPDWSPTSDDRSLAKQEGFSEAEIDREALRFRDYWKSRAGAGGVKLDWSATWRNWVRTSAEKLGKTPPSSAKPCVSSGFYATADSEQLAAWDAWSVRKRKKSMPRDKNFGWRVDTEWPPGYVREKPNVDLPAPIPILRSMQ